jgi:hypothetical protein
MFSTRQVAFREGDYRARIVNIYRSLVRGAAAKDRWEDSIYWLQELINNQVCVTCNMLFVRFACYIIWMTFSDVGRRSWTAVVCEAGACWYCSLCALCSASMIRHSHLVAHAAELLTHYLLLFLLLLLLQSSGTCC